MYCLSNCLRTIAFSVAAVAAVGCGRGAAGPETVAVTGKVTLEGQPVPQATVTFVPTADSSGAPAQAVTDESGDFEVFSNFEQGRITKPGMLAGAYAATVTKLETIPAQVQLTRAPKNIVPERYATTDSSGLNATISPEIENHILFELKK